MSTSNDSGQQARRSLRKVVQGIDLLHGRGVVAARSGIQLERSLQQVLLALGEHESLRMSELAEAMGLTSPTVSRHVTRLGELGLAARAEEVGDRRATKVTLTAQGRESYDALIDAWDRLLGEALEPEDRRTDDSSLC